MKESVLSADLISLHLDALFGGEDYFSHACPHEGFAISIGIPPPDKAIISYLHQGLSQALVFNFLISKLVDPFASGLCLWEGYGLHFVSHFFKTMLLLNAHPYTSLLKVLCHDSHTSFWLSLFLNCLFYMLLNHMFGASDILIVFYTCLH